MELSNNTNMKNLPPFVTNQWKEKKEVNETSSQMDFLNHSNFFSTINFDQLCSWLEPNKKILNRIAGYLDNYFAVLDSQGNLKYDKQGAFFSGTFFRGKVHIDLWIEDSLFSRVQSISQRYSQAKITVLNEDSFLLKFLSTENVQIQCFKKHALFEPFKEPSKNQFSQKEKHLIRLIKAWYYVFSKYFIDLNFKHSREIEEWVINCFKQEKSNSFKKLFTQFIKQVESQTFKLSNYDNNDAQSKLASFTLKIIDQLPKLLVSCLQLFEEAALRISMSLSKSYNSQKKLNWLEATIKQILSDPTRETNVKDVVETMKRLNFINVTSGKIRWNKSSILNAERKVYFMDLTTDVVPVICNKLKTKPLQQKEIVVIIYDSCPHLSLCDENIKKEFENSVLSALKSEQFIKIDQGDVPVYSYVLKPVVPPLIVPSSVPILPNKIRLNRLEELKEEIKQQTWEPTVKNLITNILSDNTLEQFCDVVQGKIRAASLYGILPPSSKEKLLQYIANSCLSNVPRLDAVMDWAISSFAPDVLEKMEKQNLVKVIKEEIKYQFDTNIDIAFRIQTALLSDEEEEEETPQRNVNDSLIANAISCARNWVQTGITNRVPTRPDRIVQFISNSCLRGVDSKTAKAVYKAIKENDKLWNEWLSMS